MCQSTRLSVHSRAASTSWTDPAKQLAVIMIRRRLTRSTSAPATGSMSTPQISASAQSRPRFATEPVRLNSQIGSANAVSADPVLETSCPTVMARKRPMLGLTAVLTLRVDAHAQRVRHRPAGVLTPGLPASAR